MIRKRVSLVIVLIILLCETLYAGKAVSFSIVHNISPDSRYHFEFRNPSNTPITTAELATTLTEQYFTVLFIGIYQDSLPFSELSVEFSPLTKKLPEDYTVDDTDQNGNSYYYPYSMRIVNKDGNQVDTVLNTGEFGGGSAVLFTNVEFNKSSNETPEYIPVAEFFITLDDRTAVAGVYKGQVTLIITD